MVFFVSLVILFNLESFVILLNYVNCVWEEEPTNHSFFNRIYCNLLFSRLFLFYSQEYSNGRSLYLEINLFAYFIQNIALTVDPVGEQS